MTRTHSYEAIVLKTYDVGEADRFCVLFTRERGRIAARAQGVRKILSRKAAALMPFQHIDVDVRESDHGMYITSAVRSVARCTLQVAEETNLQPATCNLQQSLRTFALKQEAVELVLQLIHDEEPLPDIFDALLRFLSDAQSPSPHHLLAFQIRLLHLLGLLPETFPGISEEEHAFLQVARNGEEKIPSDVSTLSREIDLLIREHCSQPLKAGAVAALLR